MRNPVRVVAKRRIKKANTETPTMEGVFHLPELGVDVEVEIEVEDGWEAVVCVTVGVGAMASWCVCCVGVKRRF
jgi:hypothetical protein